MTHLPRTFLDHCLVLIELCRATVNHLNKPFRFQTMWLLHQDFSSVVQQAWIENRILKEAILDFVDRVRRWNTKVFGNLFARKMRVLARLNGAQKTLANHPNEFLLELEN